MDSRYHLSTLVIMSWAKKQKIFFKHLKALCCTPPILMKLCMYSMDILKMVLEKFHGIPFTNKKVACRRQATQRVYLNNR